MAPSGKEVEKAETQSGVFATTHWSVVLAAGQSSSSQAAEAIDYLRRSGGQIIDHRSGLENGRATVAPPLRRITPGRDRQHGREPE